MTEHDFKIETAIYFDRMLDFIAQYRKYKNLDESDQFINSFKKGEY